MAPENFTFNIAKGRIVEYYNRVKSNDPTNSALILIPESVGGTAAQGQDFDDVTALLADANFDEVTTGGWHRGTLTDSQLVALPAPDDGNDRYAVAVPAYTWNSIQVGNNATALIIAYDSDTTAGTDANLVPLTHHIFGVTADGNNVVLNAGDFFRAS